ncbi:MAG: hypothetical protein M9905_17540 [Rhizobiaceae bacterium]|nr:hypothetical protein [Rhizobiaceae bacterium]
MTAMSGPRVPVEKEGRTSTVPVKGATTIHQGALVVNDAGYAAPGRTATDLIALGIAEESVANAGANGAKSITIRRGTFKFFNSADAQEVTAADIGKECFIADDQTVAKTDGAASPDPATRSVAGIVIDVAADGVFVRVG